jgi:hypothetical protein
MMNTLLRLKLAQELELLPEEHLPDLYRLIHYFRLGLLAASPQQTNAMRYLNARAECWAHYSAPTLRVFAWAQT